MRISDWSSDVCPSDLPSTGLEAIYQAMVLGLRDYVGKNGFPGVLIGLSGGIDSAISAAVAVDALGPDKVHCVMMPSPYTSREGLEDAVARSEEHTSEIQSLMRISYAVLCLNKKNRNRLRV